LYAHHGTLKEQSQRQSEVDFRAVSFTRPRFFFCAFISRSFFALGQLTGQEALPITAGFGDVVVDKAESLPPVPGAESYRRDHADVDGFFFFLGRPPSREHQTRSIKKRGRL
jgi:hypothetical protein